MIYRNYEEKIIEILKKHGGGFRGFNKLQKLGGFHSTSLQNALEKLEHQNKIKITRSKVGRGWTEFRLIKPHFGFKLSMNDGLLRKLIKMKKNTLANDQKFFLTQNIMNITFNKSKNLILGRLSYELLDDYPMNSKELREFQKHYWHIMVKELKDLKESDGRKLINSFYEQNPEKEILQALEIEKLHSSA